MKCRYRLFQRKTGIFFIQDNISGKQESLKTRDKQIALRIFNARNEAHEEPAINREIAKAYLSVSDPAAAKRTWQYVMDAAAETKKGETRLRWERGVRECPFDLIREPPVSGHDFQDVEELFSSPHNCHEIPDRLA